jgi:CRP/FNR family transcriptional regulator, polysaccharide utilization system transcription regulator
METILLIEDTGDILENLAEYLGMEGYKVLIAKDGKAGVDIARETPPDLIICDVLMPVMDGYDVLRELKTTLKTSIIPIIISSSLGEEADKLKALELGADVYLTKPFEFEALLEAIKTCILNGGKRHR